MRVLFEVTVAVTLTVISAMFLTVWIVKNKCDRQSQIELFRTEYICVELVK